MSDNLEELNNKRKYSLEETSEIILNKKSYRKIGITRVGVTHGLDKIGIPTASATVPKSSDSISIYSGKGTNFLVSKISAVMEAIERISATHLPNTDFIYSEKELIKQLNEDFCSPSEFTEKRYEDYDENKKIEWVYGENLINNKKIMVPLSTVITPYNPNSKSINRVFKYTHTNGLASGLSEEEAVLQAIYEVIERDAVSLAELRASIFPFAKVKQIEKNINEILEINKRVNASEFCDDYNLYQTVNRKNLPRSVNDLIEKYQRANIEISIKYIPSDLGIPTFGSSCIEMLPNGKEMFRAGYGSHSNSTIALIRSLTELAQSRIVDIQGAREDVYNLDKKRSKSAKGKHWLMYPSDETIDFNVIPSYSFNNFKEEKDYLIRRFKEIGFDKLVKVSIKSVLEGTYVVRILIPGLESWHPTGGNSVLGIRGNKYAEIQGLDIDKEISYV